MKIGLFCGSFNPIHTGHLIMANMAIQVSDLEAVWMIVSPLNPFKDPKSLLPEDTRLELINKVLSSDSKIKASAIEFAMVRPSYTIRTLEALQILYPEHEFVILIGSDILYTLYKWKEIDTILNNYWFYVCPRTGYNVDRRLNYNGRFKIIDVPEFSLSSTLIRTMVQNNKDITYLVPSEIINEVKLLYKNGQSNHSTCNHSNRSSSSSLRVSSTV